MTRHQGLLASQTIRKWIVECFGWTKAISGLRRSRHTNREKLDFQFVLTLVCYQLILMRNLKGCRVEVLPVRNWSV